MSTEPDPHSFKANDSSHEHIDRLENQLGHIYEIFESLLKTEPDPRRAGSLMAHVLVRTGAAFAILGANMNGNTPEKNLWMQVASDKYDRALAIFFKDRNIASEPQK